MTSRSSDQEKQVLALLKKGDVQAISELYDLYYDKMITIAFRVLNDNDAAKDVVQELFVYIWVRRQQLNIQSPLKPYLVKAIINRCLNYLRDNRKHLIIPLHNESVQIRNGSEGLLDEEDIKRMVSLALNTLSPRCRLIYSLSREEEMSNKEIANHLGISNKAVEKQITKALKHLHQYLKPYLSAILFCLFA